MNKGVDRSLRSDAWLFAVLASLAFAYVFARAALVPLVHDEANSYFHYVHSVSWVPFHSKWDAANHVLVMAIGNVSNAFFGPSPLSLRAFSVLCFLLFTWCAWRLGLRIKDRLLRWTCWSGLLMMPFVIEFFALFRGYGPSFALLLLSVLALLRFLDTGRTCSMFLASIAMGAGVLANLSLLPIWALVMAVLVLRIGHGANSDGAQSPLQRMLHGFPGRVLALALGLAPGLWMIAFGLGLRERGLLYYGSDRGLLMGSFASLRERLVPTLSDTAGLSFCIAVGALLTFALMYVIHQRKVREHALLVLLCALLYSELIGRMVLGEFFGVLYPKDRAILHIFPLILLAIVAALDVLAQRVPALRWASLPILLLPAFTIMGANFHRTIQWPEESISEAIHQAVRERQAVSDRGLLIAGASPLSVIWDHTLLTSGADLPTLHPAQIPPPWADLVLADARKPEMWQKDFSVLLGPDDSGQWLLQPKQEFRRSLLLDSAVHVSATNNDFIELFADGLSAEAGASLILDLEGVFHGSVGARSECMLVVQVARPESAHVFYRAIPLHNRWGRQNERSMRFTIGVEHVPQGDERLSLYIWNIGRQEITLSQGRLRLHVVHHKPFMP
jgi:hypothetical protein